MSAPICCHELSLNSKTFICPLFVLYEGFPMTMKLPSGKKLENEELVSFLKLKEEIDIKLNKDLSL